MAYVRGGSASYFSQETYQAYVKKENTIHNARLRDENETFFDAMLSDEADLTKTPEGRELLEYIGNYK